jgi:hypothetical protein
MDLPRDTHKGTSKNSASPSPPGVKSLAVTDLAGQSRQAESDFSSCPCPVRVPCGLLRCDRFEESPARSLHPDGKGWIRAVLIPCKVAEKRPQQDASAAVAHQGDAPARAGPRQLSGELEHPIWDGERHQLVCPRARTTKNPHLAAGASTDQPEGFKRSLNRCWER